MLKSKSFFYYSLLAALVSLPCDSYGAIRVGNKSRSYAAAYDQVNAIRNPGPAAIAAENGVPVNEMATSTTNAPQSVDLPIRVANPTLASQIASGDAASVTLGQLQNCGAVYPNGEFAWDMPTAGTKSGTGSQCVSVVEMRGYQMGPDGSDLVLARVNVAAGDSIKCNISEWSQSSYLPAAGTVVFPNDTEPTIEDVKAVMNQEQKQHAGIKIAAGTILAAVAGNALGEKEVGKDAMLGTNKEKLTSTAIGGLTGAAIMAGNVYGGKVAGDMILSAGVNAAAGGLIGNMAASGDSVMRVENCKIEGRDAKCLWGMYTKSVPMDANATYFYDTEKEDVWKCETDGLKNCVPAELMDIMFNDYLGKKTATGQEYDLKSIEAASYADIRESYYMDDKNRVMHLHSQTAPNRLADNKFAKIDTGTVPSGAPIPVLVEIPADKPFGYKGKDWDKDKPNVKKIWGRNADGDAIDNNSLKTKDAAGNDVEPIIKNFRPIYVSAEDGGLIDLNNKARLKGTLIGAGAGGAMGAFSAYQGAQDDIQQRWVAAVREYKDSLQKIYCATGSRFLSHYNDVVIIPNTTE